MRRKHKGSCVGTGLLHISIIIVINSFTNDIKPMQYLHLYKEKGYR